MEISDDIIEDMKNSAKRNFRSDSEDNDLPISNTPVNTPTATPKTNKIVNPNTNQINANNAKTGNKKKISSAPSYLGPHSSNLDDPIMDKVAVPVKTKTTNNTMTNNAMTNNAMTNNAMTTSKQAKAELEHMFIKILVVGEASVGKTSLVRRYVDGIFSTTYRVTIGCDFANKTLIRNAYDDVEIGYDDQKMKPNLGRKRKQIEVTLQFWDLAGQDRLNSQSRVYYREAKGAICVCDISRKNTRAQVLNWKESVLEHCRDKTGAQTFPPCILIFNKMDLYTKSEPWFARVPKPISNVRNATSPGNNNNQPTNNLIVLETDDSTPITDTTILSRADLDKVISYGTKFLATNLEGNPEFSFWEDLVGTSNEQQIIKKLNRWKADWRFVVLGNARAGPRIIMEEDSRYEIDDDLMQYTNFAIDQGFLVGVPTSVKDNVGLDSAVKILVDNIIIRELEKMKQEKESTRDNGIVKLGAAPVKKNTDLNLTPAKSGYCSGGC